jgi:hypothetical protein
VVIPINEYQVLRKDREDARGAHRTNQRRG